jgi:carbon starvation protein CstA
MNIYTRSLVLDLALPLFLLIMKVPILIIVFVTLYSVIKSILVISMAKQNQIETDEKVSTSSLKTLQNISFISLGCLFILVAIAKIFHFQF